MTLIWLVTWLFRRRPSVHMFRSWNSWGIALAVCVVLDLLTPVSRQRWRPAA